jgi:hypothetical protein
MRESKQDMEACQYFTVARTLENDPDSEGSIAIVHKFLISLLPTPSGDVESTVHPFANKWQTKESCDHISDKIIPHPCQANPENKPKAEKICSKLLKDKVFEECHLFVDAEPFYEDCLYDMCACKGDVSQCACPILASYATECARQGTTIEWRYQVNECGEQQPRYVDEVPSKAGLSLLQPSPVPAAKCSSSAARLAREHARTCSERRRASECDFN